MSATRYCPDWIFDAITADIAANFLRRDISLQQLAAKYVRGLSAHYVKMSPLEFQETAELMLVFLSEISANEASIDFLQGFGYFRVNYQSEGRRRVLTPTFSDIEEGDRIRNYTGFETIKKFRAYVFSRRSDIGIPPAPGWSLSDQAELKLISKISRNLTPTEEFAFRID